MPIQEGTAGKKWLLTLQPRPRKPIHSLLAYALSAEKLILSSSGEESPVASSSTDKRYKDCNKLFVADHGQLTFCSHQPQDKWREVIADTIEGNVSFEKTAAKIDVNSVTAFRMRYKLLHALGISQSQEDVNLNGIEELDEKYFDISHKGMRSRLIPGKKRGSSAGKRGLSKELTCIITGVDCNGRSNSYVRAYSMGKDNEDDEMKLGKHIDENSSCFTVAAVKYRKMIESRHGK